jgi:hypothetical protein
VRCRAWLRFEVGPAALLLGMVLGAITIPPAVTTFGREKEVFAREAAVGAHGAAYFLGKSLADVPFMVLGALMFVAPMVAIAPYRAPVEALYVVVLAFICCVNAVGYCLSLVFGDADNATLCGVIVAILLNLFDGFVPKLGDDPIGKIFITHWMARGLAAVEMNKGSGLDRKSFNQIVPPVWEDPNWQNDVGVLVLFAVVTFVLAFAIFVWQNRKFYSRR